VLPRPPIANDRFLGFCNVNCRNSPNSLLSLLSSADCRSRFSSSSQFFVCYFQFCTQRSENLNSISSSLPGPKKLRLAKINTC